MCCHHFFYKMTNKVYQFYTGYHQCKTLIKFGNVRIYNFTSFRSESLAAINDVKRCNSSRVANSHLTCKFQEKLVGFFGFLVLFSMFFVFVFIFQKLSAPHLLLCTEELGLFVLYKPSLAEPWKQVLGGVRAEEKPLPWHIYIYDLQFN